MPETIQTIDFSARYTVEGYRGVAFYLTGYAQRWEPYRVLWQFEDGTVEEIEDPDGDGEWIDDPDREYVIAVMVGDDRDHEVWIGDLTKIADEDVCSCGQIGCGWG